MASPKDFQFLDLKDATPDEIERIEKILYGNKKKSLVEFPWQLRSTRKRSKEAVKPLANAENSVQEYSNEELNELPTNDVIYPVVEEPEVTMVPQMVCMTPTCTVATLSHLPGNRLLMTTSVPVIQSPLPPAQPIYVPQQQMHPSVRHPLSSGETLMDNKGNAVPRRNKKKRSPNYFVADKNRTETVNVHPMSPDDQPLPMTLSPGVTVPIMVPQPIAYQLEHIPAHIPGPPNMSPYPYYTAPPLVYPNNGHLYNFMVTPGIYQSYPPTYMNHPSGMPLHNDVNVECAAEELDCVNIDLIDEFREEDVPANPLEEETGNFSSVQDLQFQVPVESEIAISQQVPSEVNSEEDNSHSSRVEPKSEKNQDVENKQGSVSLSTATLSFIQPAAIDTTKSSVLPTANTVSTFACTTTCTTMSTTVATVTTMTTTSTVNTNTTNTNSVSTTKTWASLFANKLASAPPVVPETVPKEVPSSAVVDRPDDDEGFVDQVNERSEEGSSSPATSINEMIPENLGEILSNIQLDHHSVHIVPRGLTNPGNWCYINATLQALLSCPPFFNLMRRLPVVAGLRKSASPIPVIESMVEFFHEFVLLSHVRKTSKSEGGKGSKKDEIITGIPFEPKYVHRMLRAIKSDSFKGRQEDAEEFLSCILNRLHEEMLEVMSSYGSNKMKNGDVALNEDVNNHLCDNENDWFVMGRGNKSCVTRTVQYNPSPILDIFGGMMRSMLQQAGSIKSATLQPFFTLQLDIQAENVTCIKSALEGLVVKEALQGFTSGSSKQEVEASRKITLEKLPPVLILHLKRFVYDRNGGCRKLMKRIDFGFDLELSKDLLSSVAKANHKQRKFRLCAVVYHEGQESAKGHYVADVYHAGFNSWLRTDDAKIWRIPDNYVLKYTHPRVPYLLYYRNIDTIE